MLHLATEKSQIRYEYIKALIHGETKSHKKSDRIIVELTEKIFEIWKIKKSTQQQQQQQQRTDRPRKKEKEKKWKEK